MRLPRSQPSTVGNQQLNGELSQRHRNPLAGLNSTDSFAESIAVVLVLAH